MSNNLITDTEFKDLAEKLYLLMDKSINLENDTQKLAQNFHHYVLMLTFFPILREKFLIGRDSVIEGFAKDLYKWEDALTHKMAQVESKITPEYYAIINNNLKMYRDLFAPFMIEKVAEPSANQNTLKETDISTLPTPITDDPLLYKITTKDDKKWGLIIFGGYSKDNPALFPVLDDVNQQIFKFDSELDSLILLKDEKLEPVILIDALTTDPFESVQIIPDDQIDNFLDGQIEPYQFTKQFIEDYSK